MASLQVLGLEHHPGRMLEVSTGGQWCQAEICLWRGSRTNPSLTSVMLPPCTRLASAEISTSAQGRRNSSDSLKTGTCSPTAAVQVPGQDRR